jgi:hypothetical protein
LNRNLWRYPGDMPSQKTDGLSYKDDERRKEPNNRRKGAFKTGWAVGVTYRRDGYVPKKHELKCSLETLTKKLTWWNLGYRLGRLLDESSVELQAEIYDLLERQFLERQAKVKG